MTPRRLHAVPDAAEHYGPLAVDATGDGGATLTLSPVAAVEIAVALIDAGRPHQYARMSAAACSQVTDVRSRGVTELARLLVAHVAIHVDGRDLDALVDQLDDAASPIPAQADPVETAAADAADAHLDLLRGK